MPTTDLQLDWLRAFVAVVDAGSLTAAAPHVHRSQSALSMQLKKLEDAVGRVVLTLGVPDDYAIAYLTPVLRSFATRHAGVEITLVCEQSTLLIPKVTRGEI